MPRFAALLLACTFGVTACASAPSRDPVPDGDPVPNGAAPTVQPGAPGQETRSVEAGDLSSVARVEHVQADVDFMRGMIPHHAQALEMTALVPARTGDRTFRQMALRMEISQRDEIALMSDWLRARGEEVPALGHAMHMEHRMPGMLTQQQMAELEAAEGVAFERLFLNYMIQHHEGALVMVADLFGSRGGGQDSEIFQFATDVDADQRMEIDRMRAMLDDRH